MAANWPYVRKKTMSSQFTDMMSSSIFFWRCCIFLVKFNCWSKFHVNMKTGFGAMTISIYKGFTRNLEIGNTPVWVLLNIWRLRRVSNTKFCTNVSNKMLLSTAKCQENQQGGIVKLPPIQIRSKTVNFWFDFISSLVSSTCNFP